MDKRLNDQCKIVGGARFIDDIDLSFRKLADAEHAMARLEAMLNDLELQLNNAKCKIVELPDQIESVFVTSIRPHIPNVNYASRSQWVDYFNRAFVLAKKHPDYGVLRYAVASLQSINVSAKAWDLAQTLLWQCVATDPGCIRSVIDVLLINRSRSGLVPDIEIASTAINALVQSSAVVGHGSEVLWSIWSALVLDLKVSVESQDAIALMDDPLVATAAQVAKEHHVFHNDFESPLWTSWFVTDCFERENWLFVYEALRRGWLTKEVANAKLQDAEIPKFLMANGVTFVSSDSPTTYLPKRLVSAAGVGGGGGAY